MRFVPGFRAPAAAAPDALCFGFHAGKMLVKEQDGRLAIPALADLHALGLPAAWVHYFGQWDGRPCCAVCLPPEPPEPAGFAWRGLRGLFGLIAEELVWAAGRAGQLVHWHCNHRFCGACGAPTADHPEERAKVCPGCGLINHPRVSPAVIVAVVREKRLLLAHAARFPAAFYSVLAGFVEPGESLEESVRREVLEEVGIRVEHIRYFGSQPWPFPDSLMVAFTADYAEGEIRVDSKEIADAGWFAADALPQIPPPISIARRLIDWFVCGSA
ncbi:MAG: NAD(+) diphosphatase [Desulfobacterales bacterium]|jgi:NAD+ diphosphatase|nr:NAD(+) diphosphatase [Desulfobacterales bacterium]